MVPKTKSFSSRLLLRASVSSPASTRCSRVPLCSYTPFPHYRDLFRTKTYRTYVLSHRITFTPQTLRLWPWRLFYIYQPTQSNSLEHLAINEWA
jgi:hypothetical protein